jgi:hypothetical protein
MTTKASKATGYTRRRISSFTRVDGKLIYILKRENGISGNVKTIHENRRVKA